MVKRIKKRGKVKTLLLVGEGAHDKAFLEHLKSLYDSRDSGQRVKVDAADGGSPRDIIRTVHQKYRNIDFGRRCILMDSDVPVSVSDRELAKKCNLELLLAKPVCLEGLLLSVLGSDAGERSAAQLKGMLHPQLDGRPTDKKSYARLFSRGILDSCQVDIVQRLIALLTNKEG